MNISWEAESNRNLFPNTQANWRNVWNLYVFLGEPPLQFIRRKPRDNPEYINQMHFQDNNNYRSDKNSLFFFFKLLQQQNKQ